MTITIDKAIDILSESAYAGMTTLGPDLKDAMKLGIEALKRHRDRYKFPQALDKGPLPGETEE